MDNGTLYIIATPIGNLEDVSLRAIRIMEEVDILACEDTRHTGKLLHRHTKGIKGELFVYHEHNEQKATGGLITLLKKGKSVAIVSNAGFPCISDPGYRIVSAAHENGLHIEVIPGPSAVTAALALSGLPTSGFTFKGFAPKKKGQRKRFLEMEKESPHTLIFFESPYRIGSFLEDAFKVFGDRLSAVCIELTKKFERVHRDYLSALAGMFSGRKEKGEITVVIAG
ncbi:MAG: 16S rRNA (cytidine(1402)-2'-O)-methyltransferase, partial [Spirochaetales bacterium]|nr:16S rRNA (cytidine(1402)-2'-O)-methyltransferase [Spirochaetales bacterium]